MTSSRPNATVPPIPWTCLLANTLSVLMEPDLGAEGRALVAAQIATLARLADVADDLRAEGRAQLEAEQADKTRHPVQVQVLGDGNIGVIPNSLAYVGSYTSGLAGPESRLNPPLIPHLPS
jgi:hypothetical protein